LDVNLFFFVAKPMIKIRFHILFWILIALYIFDYFIDVFNLVDSLIYTAFEIFLFATEFYLNLFFLIPFVLLKKGRIAYAVSLIVLLSATCSAYFVAGLNDYLLATNFLRTLITFFLNHVLFIFISYIIWFFNKYLEEKEKRLKLENEKIQMEMKLLKSQLNPHFLFNTLNNIYTLVLLKSDDAPEMLAALSDIMRYLVYEGNKKDVLLEAEIKAIDKYIQIQQYRRISGLENIHFEVSGDPSALKVPPLIFMTLIENALKHGDIIENKNGFVNINLTITGNHIEFNILNSFQPKENRKGIGLKNITSQMDIIFGEAYQMKIDECNTHYTVNLKFHGSQNAI